MGKVVAGFSMSLDGFIADAQDGVGRLFGWLSGGDTALPVRGSDMVFKVSRDTAELLGEEWDSIGAIVTGRRDFDVSAAWGGNPPLGVPYFIVTHAIPPEWAGSALFTFVTDGVESAITQARAAAGDQVVGVSGSKIVQQCLRAGLLDRLHIDLVPVLLGEGVRLFENLEGAPIELESKLVMEGAGITHLRYRVVK